MNHVDPITTAMLEPAAELQPARLVLTSTSGGTDLDGVWWPHSDSLHREVPFLDVAVHDATRARIARLSYTVGTWDEEATLIWTPLGLVKVGWFITSVYPRDVDLVLTDGRHAMLRVIAASTPTREGDGVPPARGGVPGRDRAAPRTDRRRSPLRRRHRPFRRLVTGGW